MVKLTNQRTPSQLYRWASRKMSRKPKCIIITGRAGAGKTTLLETVVGLLPADAGEVLWHGEPLPASERRNALFYLPDGVRPYQDEATTQVVSFFAGSTGDRRQKPQTRSVQ